MTKTFPILLLALSAVSAQAAPPSIEITSFALAGRETRAAELCGLVKDGGRHAHVRVTVDPNTSKPGIYNTFVGADGQFCMTVVTYAGRAKAEVPADDGSAVVSAEVSVKKD